MICSYLLHGCDVIRIFKLQRRMVRKPSTSVKFENENDVTPSVVSINRSCFPYLLTVLEYNIHQPE